MISYQSLPTILSFEAHATPELKSAINFVRLAVERELESNTISGKPFDALI